MIIANNECGNNTPSNWVYVGKNKNGDIVYVGTTTQKPSDRFRWHRHNGKDLLFEVIDCFQSTDDMLEKEFDLIQKLKPILNIKGKQNYNGKLSYEELSLRKGDLGWCQSCLKRRVNSGYSKCMWCK